MKPTRWLVAVVGLVVCVSSVGPVGVVGAQEVVTLTVTVEDPNGEPVANADLTATWDGGSSEATTVSNGKAFMDVERGATVEIAVDHPEFIRNDVFTVVDAAEESVTITVHPRASARVRVVDSGGPVPRAVVTFRKDGTLVTRETTDANGVVEVGPVEAGTYDVSVRKSRYLTVTEALALDGEVVRDIQIQQGTVPLTVNVSDDYFSPARPLADVSVQVADVGTVQTQPNGIQQISVPVNVRLEVRFTKDGYTTVGQTVNVGEDPLRLRVHLRRTPELSVELFSDRVVVGEQVLLEVTDEYDDPVGNATVLVDGIAEATTDADGQAALEITSAGEHEIVVERGDLTSASSSVTGVESSGATATTAGSGDGTASDGQPGFTVWTVLVGLLVLLVIGRRRV